MNPTYTIEVRFPGAKFAIMHCGKCEGELGTVGPEEKLWRTLIRYAEHKCPVSTLELPLRNAVPPQ